MKVVISIAGNDSSGGAGIGADLKTCEAFGVFAMPVLTVLTAQNTQGVRGIQTINPSFVKEQLDAIFADFEVSAIKIGMLYNNEIIDVVRDYIKNLKIPIVLDPVFVSKAGSILLSADAITNMKTLFEYVTLITPNLFEAKELFGYEFGNNDALESINRLSCGVLIKNHQTTVNLAAKSVDVLYIQGDKFIFETPFITTSNTHGTGCSYSSAIAANLALEKTMQQSIAISKEFVYYAIKNAPNLGSHKGPIHHKLGMLALQEKGLL